MGQVVYLILLILALLASKSMAQDIPEMVHVRVFSGDQFNGVAFTPSAGKYVISDQNSKILLEIEYHNRVVFENSATGIRILRNDSVLYIVESVSLTGIAFYNSFIIAPTSNNIPQRIYDGNLNIKRSANGLELINHVSFESYVAGTVQSESGFNRHPVFYQVQAAIIRTYALRNLNRHVNDGFHLCDRVHCQAYYGKTINPDIIAAVELTRGVVVVDQNAALLNTVYHANCGGQTVNSEDLWIQALPYLRSDIDTFCHSMPGASWQTTIPTAQFRSFVSSQISPNPLQWDKIILFQQNERIHHLDEEKKLPLSRIRQHFNLRSTFFSIAATESHIILSGKGYGHGVGLCQEGAMERARLGYSKEDILSFYYKGALIKMLEPLVVFD